MLLLLLSLLYMHSKREAHKCGREKKKIERCRSERVIALECVFWICLICLCICVFIEGTMRMLCDHLNPCHGSVDWHISYHWYGNVYIQCHMLYILLHLRYVVSDDWFADVNLFIFLPLYFFPPSQRFLTVHENMVPFSLTQPVIIVHRVNLALFYFALCFSLFENVSVNFPHQSWGCSQMCEL